MFFITQFWHWHQNNHDYSQGSTVEAMIYKSDIEFFRNHFQLYKRYILCNARVEYTPSEYSTHSNQCTWYIDNSTVVQAVNEVEAPQIPAVFRFSPYRRFYQHMDDNTDIGNQQILLLTCYCTHYSYNWAQLKIRCPRHCRWSSSSDTKGHYSY